MSGLKEKKGGGGVSDTPPETCDALVIETQLSSPKESRDRKHCRRLRAERFFAADGRKVRRCRSVQQRSGWWSGPLLVCTPCESALFVGRYSRLTR